MTPEQLVYGVQAPFDPQLAPDGSLIVYALTWAEDDRNRARLATCRPDGAGRMPFNEEPGEQRGARWSPDSKEVAFSADLGERGHELCVAPPGGRSRRLATSPHPISGISWSADGAWIAYCTATGDAGSEVVRVTRRPDYKVDGRGYLGDRREQVFVVAAEGGTPRQLTSGDEHGPATWSPDGRRLAMIAGRAASSQVAVVDAETGAEQRLGPDPGAMSLVAWSPSGRLLVVGDPGRTYQPDFYVLEPGARELRQLTQDLPMVPHGGYPGWMPPSPPVWLDDRHVVFHAVRGGRSGLWRLDTESGLTEEIAGWDSLHVGLSTDAERRVAVQVASALDHPAEIFVHDLERGAGATVTSFASALPPGRASGERLTVSRDGLEVEAWLLRPPDFDESRRYPVVLDIHGGPNMWHGEQWQPLQQRLAGRGYLVAFANPRGSASYGRDFTGRVFRDWGGEDYLDLMAVVDAVLARPYADASRTFVYGYSYGGYMTSWILGHTDRFRAAVVGAPCFDLVSMWGTSDIGATWDDVQWGGSPLEAAEFYRERSPSTHIHRATTPTLVVHGEADERCPIGQGEELYTWLHEAGVDCEFARYPGAAHLFPFTGRPNQRQDFLERVVEWFDRHQEA